MESFGSEGQTAAAERSAFPALSGGRARGEDAGSEHAVALWGRAFEAGSGGEACGRGGSAAAGEGPRVAAGKPRRRHADPERRVFEQPAQGRDGGGAGCDGTTPDGRDPILGDKRHAAVGEATGLVRKIALTPASRHEPHGGSGVPEDVGRLWADAVYVAQVPREGLEAHGIAPVIADNPRRHGLARWQSDVNLVMKTVRSKIEPVFGTLKRTYGLARVRDFSFARNLVDVIFEVLAFSLCRTVACCHPSTDLRGRNPSAVCRQYRKRPGKRPKPGPTPERTRFHSSETFCLIKGWAQQITEKCLIDLADKVNIIFPNSIRIGKESCLIK